MFLLFLALLLFFLIVPLASLAVFVLALSVSVFVVVFFVAVFLVVVVVAVDWSRFVFCFYWVIVGWILDLSLECTRCFPGGSLRLLPRPPGARGAT